MENFQDFKLIAEQWGLKVSKVRMDIKIEGSPDRSIRRVVIEEKSGKLFILEKIAFTAQKHKKAIADFLLILHNNKVNYIPLYLKNNDGNYISEYNLRTWMAREYIAGEKLPRQTYFYDSWRGKEMADFLISLRSQPLTITQLPKKESILYYSDELIYILKNNKQIDISFYTDFLEKSNFYDVYNNMPKSFCHGDFHPLNIIWGDNRINAVIDWEFAGIEAEIFDVANMIGCVGSESPSYLLSDVVVSFFRQIKKSKQFSEESLDFIIEFIIVLRFAGWLSLWLKAIDNKMVEREVKYIQYLIEHKDAIISSFKNIQ